MSQTPTMGRYLRAARRERRASIERAAEETRIRADFLMRMESDEFDFLAPAYVRGFLRTYATYLNLKSSWFLEQFDARYGPPSSDASQVVALDRRSKKIPKERRRLSSWMVAAIVAAVGLVSLAMVGLLANPGDEAPRREASLVETSPTPTAEPSPSEVPTEAAPAQAIAFTDGIDLEIVAATAKCWVDITADGQKLFSGTMSVGDAQSFTATSKMTIILGFPQGVELTVNGRELGSPGGRDPITVRLPDEIDQLL